MYLKAASDCRKTASEVQIRSVVYAAMGQVDIKATEVARYGMDGRDATPNLPRPDSHFISHFSARAQAALLEAIIVPASAT